MNRRNLRISWASPHQRRIGLLLVALACAGVISCAAVTNPLVQSVPVRHMPPEVLEGFKDEEKTIPLALLEQPPPGTYRLDTGDVLGVWIEEVTGDRNIPVPLQTAFSKATNPAVQEAPSPGVGYPFRVREDGAVSLPYLPPVTVRGLSVGEAEMAIRNSYRDRKILPKGREIVYASLLQKRRSQVLVFRQEAPGFNPGPDGLIPAGKRNTAYVLDMPAYENDILHALAQTGGLPSLDVYNAVTIFRGCPPVGPERDQLVKNLEALPPGAKFAPTGIKQIITIRLRAQPGEPVPFQPTDILLNSGDVVFLEARDLDLYFTGGLLPSGEHILPRDRDLDVIEAISTVKGPLVNGTFGTNNLAGNLIIPGIGNPSAALLVVVRRLPNGVQVPIRVDLTRALLDARERILVKPGDLLVLQERPEDALARYASQTILNFNLIWSPIHSKYATGIFDIMAPDRPAGRGLYSTFQQGQVSTGR